MPKKGKVFKITGRCIHRTTRNGIAGLRVEAWDKDLILNDLVGSAVTDETGTFLIQFDESYFKEIFFDRRPDLFFKVFRDEKLIESTEDDVLWDVSEPHLEKEIEVDAASVDSESEQRVSGTVRNEFGEPMSGVTVRGFDRDLRSEKLLGEVLADTEGRYDIRYREEQFRRAEKGSADLVVRAFTASGRELAASSILFNAKQVETVDLTVGGEAYRGPSEYEQLVAELTPLLQSLSFAELIEDEKHQDITFLSSETGQDPERITFLIVAHRLRKETDLPAEVFYGMFRQGLPTDLPALLTNGSETLRRSLETAIQQNIVSAKLRSELEDTLQRLQAVEVEQPLFLLKPEVLFANLTDFSNLTQAQADFITAKLNAQFRREILQAIGTASEALTKAAQAAAARLSYQQFKDEDLSTVIKDVILATAKKDMKLAEEAGKVETRLAEQPSKKVSDALRLDVPLKENHIFDNDIRRVKTLEYARIARLDSSAAKKLIEKNLRLNDVSEATLAELVKEGILSVRQKEDLRLTLELGKLTGDHLPFVSALKDRDIRSVADLIGWERADWFQVIVDHKLELPAKETAETYAENILFSIERTYPSQFLLNRLSSAKQKTRLDLLDSLDELLRNNDQTTDGKKPASPNWERVDPGRREQLQKDHQELTAFANTYRHLGVTELIHDQTLELDQKKSAITARLELLDTVNETNPVMDLRLVNFFDGKDGSLDWSTTSIPEKSLVKKQLMAYQRVLNLASDTTGRQMLLSQGYDSAVAIAGQTEGEFVRISGLPIGQARMTYAKSQESALSVSHNFEMIRDVVRGQFKNIAMSNLSPQIVNDLREIDGFDDLFTSQDFCDCEECRSVLSPAAYFVDLMHFIEQHVSQPAFINTNKTDHPLYLKNRRSDLWQLQVTCENTHTLIPYLTIVNEVLENYLQGDIFRNLSRSLANEQISFGVPFNLPLEELRLYLSHFGITLHEIYRLLKQPEEKIWRAKLNLSKEEFALITSADPVGVQRRFGLLPSESFANFPVDDYKDSQSGVERRGFIKLAGITRQQLDELLTLRFNADLSDIRIDQAGLPDELQNFPEVLLNLTDDLLDFIHRFIRLWKKTSWSIPDLDLVLTALKGASLADETLNGVAVLNLARLVDLQDKLKLTVEELCSMVHELPVSREFPKPPAKEADKRLYERLFDLRKLFEEKDHLTHALDEFAVYHHYSLNKNDPGDKEIDPKTPIVLGGLGISETEFLLLCALLKDEMPFDENGDTIDITIPQTSERRTFNRRTISLLYRHARLAKALGLSIADFIHALQLNFPANEVVTTLAQIEQLHKFRDWLKSAPFTVSELRFILTGEESSTVKYKTDLVAAEAIVQEVQKSLAENRITVDTETARLLVERAQVSAALLFDFGELTNAGGLISKLRDKSDLASEYIREKFPEDLKTQLDAYGDGDLPIKDLLIGLADALNNSITDDSFYDENRFAHVSLSAGTKTLLSQHSPGARPDRLNRCLLEDAYPQEIPRSQIEAFKDSVAKFFKFSPDQRIQFFGVPSKEVEGDAIQIALNTSFTNGQPAIPGALDGVVDLLRNIVAAIERPLGVEILKTSLSRSFNLSAKLFDDTLQSVGIDINSVYLAVAPLQSLMRQMERVLMVFSNFKFNEETTRSVTMGRGVLGIADWKKLTLDNLKAISFYKKLIALRDEAQPMVQTILRGYVPAAGAPPAFSADHVVRLTDLLRVDKSLIESLNNSLTLPFVPIKAMEDLWEGLNVCQTLGINGYSLQKLADDSDFDTVSSARDVALGAFSSRYEDEKIRRDKLEPFQDKINVIKRDALCDYIIARHPDLKFNDLHDIYAFFLLDVEMSGCARTSRVVSAISSLQLYVHRILVNLEQSASGGLVVMNAIAGADLQSLKHEWEWRKNYRVWEANRKVFLYPETYIEPDLRDDKTPIFKELEDELLQEKITKESAESAYKKYVSQFAELARLRIAGSYYHKDAETYYFFGRTQQDPPQYYYRKWIDTKVWTPWEKIELGISALEVSAISHLGRLFLFWVSSNVKEKTSIFGGRSTSEGFEHKIYINYSYQRENGKWIPAQKLYLFGNTAPFELSVGELLRAFPKIHDNKLHLTWFPNFIFFSSNETIYPQLDLFDNSLIDIGESLLGPQTASQIINVYDSPDLPEQSWRGIQLREARLGVHNTTETPDESKLDSYLRQTGNPDIPVTSQFLSRLAVLSVVGNKLGDLIFVLGNQQYLIRRVEYVFSFESWIGSRFGWRTERISTSLVDGLGEILFSRGLEAFLSLDTQKITEHEVGVEFNNPSELLGPYDDPDHIDFTGAYGIYYKELFFHIPFLIANHLNANQKFEEAKWWHERIFDPTASESPEDTKPTDRNWRYIEFRGVTFETMRAILTNPDAIEKYKKDPFNPHAIARLRLCAYPKAIVMKYIDNLLDWGDDLFAQDTTESINEATMLYVLAADILGKRPVKLGKCKTAEDEQLTYEEIGRALGIGPGNQKGSEFLINLENWNIGNLTATEAARNQTTIALNSTPTPTGTVATTMTDGTAIPSAATVSLDGTNMAAAEPRYSMELYTDAVEARAREMQAAKASEVASAIKSYPGLEQVRQSTMAFCVPPNYDLLKYWDRVEDRLFKIRHCMNISGVRRQLALFQPPIDPMALVRARAGGLSLGDILEGLAAPLPPYRFSYLIEKAKQFTQTVQNFGSALLSALEKKDVEELTLLRSVHEREVLRMTKEIKKHQVKEAQHQYHSMVETKTNVQNRLDYYDGLIKGGLTGWEVTQQVCTHFGTGYEIDANVSKLMAGILYLLPQIGSPFAMKFGGVELGSNAQAIGLMLSSLAAISRSMAISAGLEASFQRREQEWANQLLLAQQELKQVEQQRLAAEVRQLIAEKDLEIHDKNMEQADELNEFYKNKFTNLGLYNYLSTTLNRLYREAYNVAQDLAKMAQITYQFERDDDTAFIAGDNWQFDRAGLLAGERLLLQLQRLEKAYLEQNKRENEVTQSFSLALLNPSALVALRQTGSCEFSIPEILFDLFYPGQYKRIIKSVRLTIPCVAGPYTNIGAKLSLKGSQVRKVPTTDPGGVIALDQIPQPTSIATSNAQNDGGQFELNFRDERYLPFEGAGAISTWGLELPSRIRMFDYDTISDVIVHISYTAKDDGAFKATVENQIVEALTRFAATPDNGLYRLFSLRHEFPNSFHQLLNSSGAIQATEFDVTRQHFPYFLADNDLLSSQVTVYLKPKGTDPVATTGSTIRVNGAQGVWSIPASTVNLKAGEFTPPSGPITKWTINAGTDGLDKEELDDILIVLKYTI